MAEIVDIEGEWKDFIFKMIEPEDYPKVLDHMRRVFYRDETMFKLIEYSDELADEVDLLVTAFLNQNDKMSFYAIHKESRKVAGVRITYKNTKGSERPDCPVTVPEHKRIIGFVKNFSQGVDVHEEYGVESYAEFFMTSVDPEFRRCGLVTEMYSRSLKLIKSKGYTLVESFFSSPHTRKIATKFGFTEVKRFYYIESKFENGLQRFPKATPDQFIASMVKVL